MSFTCKYLQTLAFDQFQRQYPKQFITIETKKKNREILVDSNRIGKHVKYQSNIEKDRMLAGFFIRNNPQVKDITCYGNKITKAILHNAVDIKRLAIQVDLEVELRSILDDLQTNCKNSPIECLEFDFVFFKPPETKLLEGSNQTVPIYSWSIESCTFANFYRLFQPSWISKI